MPHSTANTNNPYPAFLELATTGQQFFLKSLQGKQSLNGDDYFEITLVNLENSLLINLLGEEANLNWCFNATGWQRQKFFSGYIAYCLAEKVTLFSQLHTLQSQKKSRVYVNKNIAEIIKHLFRTYQKIPISIQLKQSYPIREMVLQYQLTDFEFLQHQCAYWGLIYRISQTPPVHLQIVDDLTSLQLTSVSMRYQPGSGLITAEPYIYAIRSNYQLLPQTVRLKEYQANAPPQNLKLSKESVSAIPGLGICYDYGENYQTLEEGEQLLTRRLQALAVQRYQLYAWTNHLDLQAGQLLKLEDEAGYGGEYRIISISHHLLTMENVVYFNKIILIPATIPYRPPYEKQKNYQPYLSALIESPDATYPHLDALGCYRIRFDFDEENSLAEASCPLRMAQSYSGPPQQGWHWPLTAGTEVLVGFMNGDADRPILLGALPSTAQPGPSHFANSKQHCIRTRNQHSMIFDDSKEQSGIKISTANDENKLEMFATSKRDYINLMSQRGNIYLTAGADYQSISKNLYTAHIGQHYTVKVSQNFNLQTQRQDILYQAGKDIHLVSESQALRLQTQEESINYKSKGNSYWQSKQATKIFVKIGHFHMHVPEGKLQYEANNSLTIQAQQQIVLMQGSGRITIEASGNIHLQSPHIFIHGKLQGFATKEYVGGVGDAARQAILPDSLPNIADATEMDKHYWAYSLWAIGSESTADEACFYRYSCSRTASIEGNESPTLPVNQATSDWYQTRSNPLGLSLLSKPKGEQLQQFVLPNREIVQIGQRKLTHPLDWVKPTTQDFNKVTKPASNSGASIAPKAEDLEIQLYSLFPPILVNLREEN